MLLRSTRDRNHTIEPLKGVLKGIAPDGGLFVPDLFPEISEEDLQNLKGKSYEQIAARILSLYLDVSEERLFEMTKEAYSSFDTSEVVPLTKLSERDYVLELWHGPTLAFKDMALQMLPRLMSEALSREEDSKKILILTATSGDTGKAALEGFRDVERTGIIVFYPEEGVSDMQKLQMVTQRGGNTHVCAVKGNFDDAQTGVKQIFGSLEMNRKIEEKGYSLSSANSINIGRLVPQIVYYIYAYVKLMEEGKVTYPEPVNFTVPTGNFGNILAAYYAKRMGLPIGKLICASNSNNVLTEFFKDGHYNAKRTFYKTMSPSMDILISSNLERLLYELTGRDSAKVADMMKQLKEDGKYVISADMKEKLDSEFYADFCDEKETAETIKNAFAKYGYLMDTHTAVAYGVYDKYVHKTGDTKATVIASTANPYKFTADVYSALTGKEKEEDAFEAAKALSEYSGVEIPAQIAELKEKPVLHKENVAKTELKGVVKRFAEGTK